MSPSATTPSLLLLLSLSNDDGRTSNFNSDNPTSPTLSSSSLNNRKDKDKEDDVSFAITSSPNKAKQNKNTTSNEEHILPTTLFMQNGSKYVPPHLKKVKEDGKEHHQGARSKKEDASRDPNFDRDNPTSPVSSEIPSTSTSSSVSIEKLSSTAVSITIPPRKARGSSNQTSIEVPSRKASIEVLSSKTIHGKIFVPLSKLTTRSDTMKMMSHLEKKKVFRILKIKKNDGTIKRRLVSDMLPSIPLETPIPSDSYRHYREATMQSKKITHKKLINRSDMMKIMSHLDKKKVFRIIKTTKNDGTIKRRLVSDMLPSVPLEAPITSDSYRTARSKDIRTDSNEKLSRKTVSIEVYPWMTEGSQQSRKTVSIEIPPRTAPVNESAPSKLSSAAAAASTSAASALAPFPSKPISSPPIVSPIRIEPSYSILNNLISGQDPRFERDKAQSPVFELSSTILASALTLTPLPLLLSPLNESAPSKLSPSSSAAAAISAASALAPFPVTLPPTNKSSASVLASKALLLPHTLIERQLRKEHVLVSSLALTTASSLWLLILLLEENNSFLNNKSVLNDDKNNKNNNNHNNTFETLQVKNSKAIQHTIYTSTDELNISNNSRIDPTSKYQTKSQFSLYQPIRSNSNAHKRKVDIEKPKIPKSTKRSSPRPNISVAWVLTSTRQRINMEKSKSRSKILNKTRSKNLNTNERSARPNILDAWLLTSTRQRIDMGMNVKYAYYAPVNTFVLKTNHIVDMEKSESQSKILNKSQTKNLNTNKRSVDTPSTVVTSPRPNISNAKRDTENRGRSDFRKCLSMNEISIYQCELLFSLFNKLLLFSLLNKLQSEKSLLLFDRTMNRDNEHIHLIKEDLPSKLKNKINWLKLDRVTNISATSRRTGKSYEAILFSDNPELLQELMVISLDGNGYLFHDRYQGVVDAVIHVRIYYLDKRNYFDERWVYHFHDQKVDQKRISDCYEQVKGWSYTTMEGNHVRVNDRDALFAPAEEIIEV